MDYREIISSRQVEFGQMPPATFLLGLLSAFENRYQTVADSFFSEITWKQFFAIICINLCRENPTINELSDIMASSHQNVKQILNKLEKKGYVQMVSDDKDKRKQRIKVTEKTNAFCKAHDEGSQIIVKKIFEGIDEKDIETVIKTLLKMEKNLEDTE